MMKNLLFDHRKLLLGKAFSSVKIFSLDLFCILFLSAVAISCGPEAAISQLHSDVSSERSSETLRLCKDLTQIKLSAIDEIGLREEMKLIDGFFGEYVKSAKQKKDLPKGMFPEEAALLRSYTGPGYLAINRFLRKMECQKIPLTMEVLASAVNKAPGVRGHLYRRFFLTSAEIKRTFHPDSTWITSAFMSTSREKIAAEIFHGNVFMQIEEGNGGDINAFSQNRDEYEVLLNPGTEFQVIRVEKTDLPGEGGMGVEKGTLIELRQMTQTPHDLFQ